MFPTQHACILALRAFPFVNFTMAYTSDQPIRKFHWLDSAVQEDAIDLDILVKFTDPWPNIFAVNFGSVKVCIQ